jgi:hypothetical protein
MLCVEKIEALLGRASSARLARMHMDAIGSAIDLRSARLDEIDQRMVEPALLHLSLGRHQHLDRLGRRLVGVQPWSHRRMPFGCLLHCAVIGMVDLVEQQGGNQRDEERQPNPES